MIPLHYREKVPPYWYENRVADYHFEAAGSEAAAQKQIFQEMGKQLLLPFATYSMDVWDWIYFGDVQLGTLEQRRSNIRKKLLAKTRFTKATLAALAQEAGSLIGIEEDFHTKEIVFEFAASEPLRLASFLENFEKIRPVHVNRANPVAKATAEPIVVTTRFGKEEVDYLACGTFYCGADYPEPGEGATSFVFLAPAQFMFTTNRTTKEE